MRLPKKFSTRNCTKTHAKDEVSLTDFIALGQCVDKTGPHGKGMAFLQDSVSSVNSLPNCFAQTLRSRRSKGTKDRQGSDTRRQARQTEKLSKVPDPPPPSSFLHFDYGEKESQDLADKILTKSTKRVLIDDWRVVDNFTISGRSTTSHIVFHDRSGKFLFAKVAQRQSCNHLGGYKRIRELVQVLKDQVKWRPQIFRGKKKKAGKGASYTLHGLHKDPSGNGLISYAWKKGTPKKIKKNCKKSMADFQLVLERCCRAIDSGMAERKVASQAVKAINLPHAASDPKPVFKQTTKEPKAAPDLFATALAMGTNYWSPSHIDEDLYLTALCFLFPSENFEEENFDLVLQNFCFPEYKIRVPMRAGEVIIFNPYVQHCCSNPRFEGSFTASNFLPLRTVREAASQHVKDAEMQSSN